MGVQLDFSEASVQALEGMLENLHREMALPSEEQIRSEALTFGCYLGEAMLRGGLADVYKRQLLSCNGGGIKGDC